MSRQTFLPGLFPSVRTRLLAMLTAAAIPLFALAASIAVQNFRVVMERSGHATELLLAAARARNELETEQLTRLLAGLARQPELRTVAGDACTRLLRVALDIAPPRLSALLEVGSDDAPLCAVAAAPAIPSVPDDWSLPALRQVRAGAPMTVVLDAATSRAGLPMLVAALALEPANAVGAADHGSVLLARVAVDWLAPGEIGASVPGTVTWLAGPQDQLLPLGPAASAAAAVPRPERLAALLRQAGSSRIDLSQSGLPYAYSATPLRGGLRLVVAVRATSDLVRADALLGRRLFELGGLLMVGLLAMALGAHAAVVRPIKHLSRAVHVWRDGGAFDPTPTEGAPREVIDLAQTFAEATSALRAREVELRAAATRQELLMQEIHHRVKNNLQIVASLLNLQASRIRLPEARAEFQAARDRIRALATLHRHLYAHGELHTINMRAFLAELCDQLIQALGTPQGGPITLDIEAPELQLSSDQAVPLALIVTEAVSNAVKYAFPGGRRGHIAVRVDVLGADAAAGGRLVRLVIQDDGVGIPAGRAETADGVRDGIGLQLIRGFARQLGATLEVTHDGGTRYALELALRRERSEHAAIEPPMEPAPNEPG